MFNTMQQYRNWIFLRVTKTGRMPERTNHSALEKCNSCATSNGSGLGPIPTVSHAEVCCLFKVAAPGCQCSANSFLNEGCPKQYDGRCQGRPSRLKALRVCPVHRPGQRSTSDASQEGKHFANLVNLCSDTLDLH